MQIIQLFLQAGAAFALLLLAGCAYARVHTTVVQQHGRPSYWPLFKQGYFVYLLMSAVLMGWFFEEGGAIVEFVAAAIGLVVGLSIGLVSTSYESWMRRSLATALVFIAADCILEAADRSYLGGFVGAVAVGLAIAAGAGVLSAIAFLVVRKLGGRWRTWSLRVPVLASLLLVMGGPFLWLVVAAGTIFGFAGARRFQLSTAVSTRSAYLLALAAVAFAHTVYSFYFSFMSSYGIFSHPVVSVSPYALVSITIGAAVYRMASTDSLVAKHAA